MTRVEKKLISTGNLRAWKRMRAARGTTEAGGGGKLKHPESYASGLADCLDTLCSKGEVELGVSDAELCAKALRYMARSQRPKGKYILSLVFLPAFLVGLGMSDFDGNGKSLVADMVDCIARDFVPENAVAAEMGKPRVEETAAQPAGKDPPHRAGPKS